MRIAPILALLLVLAPCALTHDPMRAQWSADWNRRIDTASTPFDHPCATKAFIAWADGFLVGCMPDPLAPDADEHAGAPVEFQSAPGCDERVEWVDERVAQCRPWTAWYLRNFNKHERSEGSPPEMRIE
jgi:hypothetical protein